MAWQDFIDIEFIKLNGKHMSGALVGWSGSACLLGSPKRSWKWDTYWQSSNWLTRLLSQAVLSILRLLFSGNWRENWSSSLRALVMAQHCSSWSHRTLTIWLQYLLIGVCAVPFAVLTLFLTRKGMQEQTAFLVAIGLTLAASYSLWRVVISSPQRATTALLSGALVLAFVPLVFLFAAAAFVAFVESALFGKSVARSRRPFTPKQPVDTTPPPKRPISN